MPWTLPEEQRDSLGAFIEPLSAAFEA